MHKEIINKKSELSILFMGIINKNFKKRNVFNKNNEVNYLTNSSQNSAPLLVCGITIVPPTIFATAKIS